MLALTPRQWVMGGLLIGAIGAAAIAAGAVLFLRSPSTDHSVSQRRWTLVGAALVCVGFLVQLGGQLAR
jgi:hypothetical protein